MLDYVDQINSIRLCAESDDPVDECCWEDCSQHHGSRDNMCRQKIMMEAADAIEELLAAVPHWISVEERLPEKWKHCLLRFKNNNDSWGGIELGYLASDGKTWSDTNHTITHWMPLPEPPKEVE